MSQTANKLKRCSKCYISNKLPNIQLDESGVCNLCLSHDEIEHLKNEKSALKDMLAVFRSVKEASKNIAAYDCVVALSGGKDSSYVLKYYLF